MIPLPTGNWRDTLTSLAAQVYGDVQSSIDAHGGGEDIGGFYYQQANKKYMGLILGAIQVNTSDYSHVDLNLWNSVTQYKKSDLKAQAPAPAGLIDPIVALNYIEMFGRALNTVPADAPGIRDGIVFGINNGLSIQSAINYASEYMRSHAAGFGMGDIIKIGVGIIFSAAAAPFLNAAATSIGTSVGLTGEAATAVGKIAIATAQNGGDVAKSIKSYGVSYLSMGVGDQAGDFVDSESAGKLVSVATNAALRGGDVRGAVGGAALSLGLTNLATGAKTMFDDTTDNTVYDDGTDDNPGLSVSDTGKDYIFGDDGSTTWTDTDGSTFITYADGSVEHIYADGTMYVTDEMGDTYLYNSGSDTPTPVDAAQSNAAGSIWDSVIGGIDKLGTVMAKGIQLNSAWQRLKGPAPRVASTVRTANGSTITPNKNGTVLTRTPDGKTTTAKMPVGVPFVFPDGSTVINNGDGTITTLNADGTTYTTPIANVTTGGSSTGLLIFGGIAAILLLKG